MKKNRIEITGRYQATGRGYGFLVPEEGGGDYFLPPRTEGGAWHNDIVTALPDPPVPGGGRPTASVTGIVERGNRTVTGVVFRHGREVWLAPDSDRLPSQIRVVGRRAGLRGGDRAALTMTSFGDGRGGKPMGVLAEVFGRTGSRDTAAAAILYQYGIRPEFPPDVAAAAARAPQEVPPEALYRRLDLRAKCIITIDGASAKDLDDAVSLERDGAGRLVLGVHIADVGHYVPMNSALDAEAWNRGTSVYYADKVVPMLPPALSNGICSLSPDADRLTLSCFMILGEDGAVTEHTIVKSVIRSRRRMTYEDCNSLLSDGDSPLAKRYADILPMLREMASLAAALRKKRMLRGSLDLETREVAIRCDAQGAPIGVEIRKQGVSESLIEEFMLLANETVAEHLLRAHSPAVYRIHEKPSSDKTEALRALLAPLGYDLPGEDGFALQNVLRQSEGKPEQTLIHMLVLRSLMKARYDSENLGHFGLAAEYYCHFTSPIRRYPDLLVHRQLWAMDSGGKGLKSKAFLEEAALECSAREERNDNAYFAANDRLKLHYLHRADTSDSELPPVYEAVITKTTPAGLLCDITELGLYGFVPSSKLSGSSMNYNRHSRRLKANRGHSQYKSGDIIFLVLDSLDFAQGRALFRPA